MNGYGTAPAGSPPAGAAGDLLRVENLVKHFDVSRGVLLSRTTGQVRAVDGISFSIRRGETLGLVGETGCGKSTTGRVLAGFLPATSGQVTFDGRDAGETRRGPRHSLHREIQMIFQDPYSALNPRHTVGTIIAAPFRYQEIMPPGGIRAAVEDLLSQVGLSPEHYNRYPREFSGGQRQRICVARAIALRPRLIIADEPVSALDVSIQAQIINLLSDLRDTHGLAYLFIAHDLSVVRHIADRVAVMYLGKLVELADNELLYAAPRHPYTKALLSAVPVPSTRARRQRLSLPGEPPSPLNPPAGCRFHTRCWKAQDVCRTTEPPLAGDDPRHLVACHFPEPPPAPVAGSPADR
ncbi:MAG TPA: oligopeptide/dipeptide ABC transporter ATP-binding protein [Streptosporangiaceae bacterium]